MIISGPLSQVPNVRQILEAYIEMRQANQNFSATPTFLGLAGTKLFRDEIWGRLRFPFRADYMEYKRGGVFDFPQQYWKVRIKNAIMLLLSRYAKFRIEVNKRMKDEMIKPP